MLGEIGLAEARLFDQFARRHLSVLEHVEDFKPFAMGKILEIWNQVLWEKEVRIDFKISYVIQIR